MTQAQVFAMARRLAGLSQTDLGRRIGCSVWRICRLEHGSKPRTEEILLLERELPVLKQLRADLVRHAQGGGVADGADRA
jgi:ribosome-binding protein aMBF1 (putative translation factor)